MVSGLVQTAPGGGRNRAYVSYSLLSIPLANGGASGVEDDSDDEEYEDDRGYPVKHDGDVLAKSPPSHPFFSGVFRMPRPFRNQTLEHPVQEHQLATFPCRLPRCPASVRSDVAARLGGFCCDTHM